MFEISKPAQKLSIFSSLGTVDVELELEDRTVEMQVEPMHAAIIYLFEDQGMLRCKIRLRRSPLCSSLYTHTRRSDLFQHIWGIHRTDIWTLAAISAKLQVPEESLEQKMQLWIREGVLKEIGRFQYQLIENASTSS